MDGNIQVVQAIREFSHQLRRESCELTKAIISLTEMLKQLGQGNGNGPAANKADQLATGHTLGQKLENIMSTQADAASPTISK